MLIFFTTPGLSRLTTNLDDRLLAYLGLTSVLTWRRSRKVNEFRSQLVRVRSSPGFNWIYERDINVLWGNWGGALRRGVNKELRAYPVIAVAGRISPAATYDARTRAARALKAESASQASYETSSLLLLLCSKPDKRAPITSECHSFDS